MEDEIRSVRERNFIIDIVLCALKTDGVSTEGNQQIGVSLAALLIFFSVIAMVQSVHRARRSSDYASPHSRLYPER